MPGARPTDAALTPNLLDGQDEGNRWTLSGEQERATIDFGDDGRTQTHAWQRLVDGQWLPLCDRVATRVD